MTITLNGRIGKDAVLRKFGEGEHDFVTDIWVAENRKKRDDTVETLWHKVTIWRNYAESMAKYLTAGRRVLVYADSVRAKFYTNKNQQIVPYIDIAATKIELLDAPKTEESVPEVEETVDPANAPF